MNLLKQIVINVKKQLNWISLNVIIIRHSDIAKLQGQAP